MNSFDQVDFTPSADGTLDNMKYGGIDVPEIVQELKDNCDDAASKKTTIYLLPKDSTDNKLAEFLIHDTGRGMVEENLWNAMRLAHRHQHGADDIGKFGVGLKNATMGLGDQITIVTKTESSNAIGILLNIPDMRRQNTFKPTQYESDASALRGQFPSSVWQEFVSSTSGTLISVKGIHEHHIHDVDTLALDVHRSLNFNYTDSTESETVIRTGVAEDSSDRRVKQLDAFYRKNPEHMEYCHETELRLYTNGRNTGIYEVLTDRRKRGGKYVNGSPEKPLFFKMNPLTKKAQSTSDAIHSPVNELPEGPYKAIQVRFVEVRPDSYAEEGKSGDWDGCDSRRRGFFFRRGKRMVGTCMSLEEQMNDSCNHLRMEVVFQPNLDLEMGVRTQKQMSKSLHSTPISDALRVLWKQLANARIKIRSDAIQREKAALQADSSESSDEAVATPQIKPPRRNAIQNSDVFGSIANAATTEAATDTVTDALTGTVNTLVYTGIQSDSTGSTESEHESAQTHDSTGALQPVLPPSPPPSPPGWGGLPQEAPEPEYSHQASDGYLRLVANESVVSRIPSGQNLEGLKGWISSVNLPVGKTQADLFNHVAQFWGLC